MTSRVPVLTLPVIAAAALVLASPAAARAASPVSDTPQGTWGVNVTAADGSASSVYFVLRTTDRTYLVGKFSKLVNYATGQTVSVRNVAALLPDGSPDPGFTVGTDGPVRRMVAGPDGNLYLGGAFTRVYAGTSSIYQPRVARFGYLDGSAALDRDWRPSVSGAPSGYNGARLTPTVYALAFSQPDVSTGATKVYVGGSFTSAGSQGLPVETRTGLAAFDLVTGDLDATWTPGADNGTVNDLHGPSVRSFLVTSNGLMYVTGEFDQINGDYGRPALAQVSQSTGALTNFRPFYYSGNTPRPALNGYYHDGFELALATGYYNSSRPILFMASGGISNNLFSFDAETGQRWTQLWTDGDVQTVAVQDGYLYAGGHFLNFYGNKRVHIARLQLSSGAVDTSWAPALYPQHSKGYFYGVWSLAPYTDPDTGTMSMYVGGAFKNVNSSTTTAGVFKKFLWFQNG